MQKCAPYPNDELTVDVAAHVETVGVREVALVAVGGAVERGCSFDPRGMVMPWNSTSRATHRDCIGDGASKRMSSSTALLIKRRVVDEQLRWSGTARSVTAPKPSSRATVSVPADEISCMNARISSSVSVRVVPSRPRSPRARGR